MEEYYTLEISVTHHSHPVGLPRHNDHRERSIADFKIRDVDLTSLIARGVKHIDLVEE